MHGVIFAWKTNQFVFSFPGGGGVNDQLPNSDISELHRLRRELLEEQDRVQRLSAQLSTNVSHLVIRSGRKSRGVSYSKDMTEKRFT